MLVKEALQLAIQKLQGASSSSSIDARVLLCKALSISFEQLILSYEDQCPKDKLSIFWQFIERRVELEPIAYILGKQEFYGLDFLVNHHVLIPRPETEMIIDLTIDFVRDIPNAHILELGTGSGIIAICLAKNLPHNIAITATDISANALEVACKNAMMHDVQNIVFLESNWFENIKSQKFDIIISNPPYISKSEEQLVSDSAHLYEPHLALYAPRNGLENYYIIARKAAAYLNANGKIILEIGYEQVEEVSKIFTAYDFHNIKLIKDYSGHPRNLIISH
jgi:release factor glutamine methyltransferase